MAEVRPPTLEMRGISKTFPGVKALNNVQLKAWGGEVQALMGENGAGKSTLMKILSGRLPGRCRRRDPDRRPGRWRSPTRSPPSEHGIAIIYQELSLAPNLSGGREHLSRPRAVHSGGMIDREGHEDSCRAVLERLGATFGPETIVGTLSIAEQQLVEIARALHAKSKILVMDEPTTALSSRETERLFALIRQLRDEGHGDHLHQPPHGRGLRAVRPGLGAARRHLCRHAGQATSISRREAGQDDGRPRSQHLLQAGARRRKASRGQGQPMLWSRASPTAAGGCKPCQLPLQPGRGARASPGWSAPAAPNWRG